MNNLLLLLWNCWFYLLFVLLSAVYIPLGMLIVLIARMTMFSRRQTMRLFRRLIRLYGIMIIKALFLPMVKVEYCDLAPDERQGPFIFISNHRSASDAFLMACPGQSLECVQVVNTWPFRIPVIGLFARWAGYLSVNELPFEVFSSRAVRLLKEGVSIFVFPEGTRSGKGPLGQFRGSMFRVALESGCPIVPLCITGNERVPPRGSWLLNPGLIKVHKLAALRSEEYGQWTAFKLKNRVREIISEHLATME